MLDPEYVRTITEASEELSVELHDYIIEKIIQRMMNRMGRGEDYLLTAADKWQIEILEEAGYLYSDIVQKISKYTKVQEKEIKAAMEDAGVKALEWDNAVYSAAGLSPAPILQSPGMIRIMQRNYDATATEMRNFTRSTAIETQQLFFRELDKAYNLVVNGATSYTQAVSDAIEQIVKGGVYIKYHSGHRDTIETATLRAVRAGVSRATGEIQIKRMEEMEWDIILTSAHIGARTGDGGRNPGNHLWWQGQFFSRTGRTKEYPNFYESTGYGTGEGLCGWG